MQRRSGRMVIALAPVFAAMIIASCGTDNTTGPVIASLVLASGAGQTAPAGSTLPLPLTVRAQDQANQPVSGVTVLWEVTAGGGSVSPAQSITGSDGLASTTLRLGAGAGANTVTATFSGGQPVVFSATALPLSGQIGRASCRERV